MVDLMQSFAVPGQATRPPSGLPGYPQSPLLNQAHAYWLSCRRTAEMPSWRDLDTALLDPLRPSAMLFEVQRDPLDYRYVEIGSRIAAISNADNTGRLISELPHQRPPSRVWDHFTAAFDARAPVKGTLPYVGRSRDVGGVFHIVLPLADDGETVDRLLVCVDLSPAVRLADGTHPFTQLGRMAAD